MQFWRGWQELGRSNLDIRVTQKKVTGSWWAVLKLKQKWEPLAKVGQAGVTQNQGVCL